MLIPTEFEGGSVTEQPLVDLVVLAEELGRDAQSRAVRAVQRGGRRHRPLRHRGPGARSTCPASPGGEATAAWCLSGDGSPEPGAVEVRATRDGDGWRLDGVARYVQAAAQRRRPAGRGDRPRRRASHNFLVPRPSAGLSERTLAGLDLTRRFAEVRFDGVDGARQRRAARRLGRGGALPRRWPPCCRRPSRSAPPTLLFEATVDYAKKRVQFGRTIGSFQAIKHRLADLLIELEAMRAAAHYAALALGDGLRRRRRGGGHRGRLRRRHVRPSLRRGAPAPRRHRVHLGARRPPLRAPGQGEPGALRRRRLAPGAPRAGSTETAAGGDGRPDAMDVIVPPIPDSYDDYRATLARVHRRAQAGAGVEAAHRAAGARPRRGRRAAARLRPGPLRRRLRARPLLDRTG